MEKDLLNHENGDYYHKACDGCGNSFMGEKRDWLCKTCEEKVTMENKYPIGGYSSDYYQPLFDLMHQEHGLILLESEMKDIICVVMRMEPTGPVWVKASELKTDKPVYRPYRKRAMEDEGEYDYGEIYITEDGGEIFLDIDNENNYTPQSSERWREYEILDEHTER